MISRSSNLQVADVEALRIGVTRVEEEIVVVEDEVVVVVGGEVVGEAEGLEKGPPFCG